jgi:hypothetical protein
MTLWMFARAPILLLCFLACASPEGPSFVNHGAWLLELQQQLDALGAAPVPEPRASITYTQVRSMAVQ